MKIERTKNSVKGIQYGLFLKVYQIIMPFIMRTLLIHYLGLQYAGLNGLFTSVLQVLNLAELGVGSAMVFSMYKPIAADDNAQICALMNLYKKYYRLIGIIIAIIGLVLIPFLKFLIKGDIPADINIYLLYIIELSATVVSYWLFAYKGALFSAHQRNDIVSIIKIITSTIQYFFQIFVLVVWRDYYLYILIALGSQILNNILTGIWATHIYPDFKAVGNLDEQELKSLKQRIRDLFTSKVGGVIVTSADSIVISAFLGLSVLAIYQNYYLILTSIIGIISVIHNSCLAGVGNSLITEKEEKNYKDFKEYTFIVLWITGFCTCGLLCTYQDAMELWQGRDCLMPYNAVICLCIYFYIYELNQLLNVYKDAGGIWRKDRFRPLVTAGSNLVINLLLVNTWGLYGVLLSTVFSTVFVGMPWLFHNLFTTMFDRSNFKRYFLSVLKYTVTTGVLSGLCIGGCLLIPWTGWIGFMVKGIVCTVFYNVAYYYTVRKTEEFNNALAIFDKITSNRFNLNKRINRHI